MNVTGNNKDISADAVPQNPFTLKDLIDTYQTDPVSTYQKLRYHVRKNHENLLRRLSGQCGNRELSTIKARDFKAWHADWSKGEKFSIGHAFMAQLRTVFSFGATMLENEQCERLCMVLHRMKFPMAQPRTEYLTAAQAVAIRSTAKEWFGWYSMALAQALQFELILRQKDVIGEWVPENEPGESDVTWQGEKWLRGLRWSEIDDNMVLRHVTSKKQKDIQIDLRNAPMLVEELEELFPGFVTVTGERMDDATGEVIQEKTFHRDMLPTTGPIVICDVTGMPWYASEYRRKWRLVANQAGVPKEVRSMDSRAGAITEATQAGASIEHVKHAATHSDISQTQRYSRGSTDKIANVQAMRRQHRFRQIS